MRRFVFLGLTLAAPTWPQAEFFEARIRPVLIAHCHGCHDASKATSGLRLDSKEGLQRGGSRGTAVRPGDADASLLYRAISYRDPMLKMPPSGKLPDAVIADFRQWIEQGAGDPRTEAPGPPQPAINWDRARLHWSFQPCKPVVSPKVRNIAWPRSPIDAFVLARLEEANLSPAAPAGRATLLRRASFGLTGLPPTPEELDAFLKDTSPAAFDKVVDRLLASPHYGERWARHWLDLVRFAETNGHEFDFYKDEAWRYRDYVIRAFNEDLPYNRFAGEHIAGDQVAPRRLSADGKYWETPLASGFFGLGEERNGATDLEEVRSEMRDSKIDVFGKAFLGLTVACARCHDHKFDPISTTDYYALGGIFDSTRTTLASISSPEVGKQIEEIVTRLKADAPAPAAPQTVPLRHGDELFDMHRFSRSGAAFAEAGGGRLDSSRGVSDKLTGIMVSGSFIPTKRYIHVRVAGTRFNPVREEPSLLAVTIFAPGRYPKGVAGDGDRKLRWKTIPLKEEVNQVCHLEIADRRRNGHIAVDAIVFSDSKEPPQDISETLAPVAAGSELEASLPAETFGRVSYEDVPHNLRIHERGNHLNLGREVPRRFLRILDGEDPEPYSNGSGRLALAVALTRPSNPLLARVMVNRIWKHHFGEGLVRSVDNFGRTGEQPSHPELLDYLAQEFISRGWSMKAMHRTMMLSAAYRMGSTPSAAAQAKDPQNRLLSHWPVRRLDAEAVRDAILAVSGSLDKTVYGPSVPVHVSQHQDGRGKPATGPLDGAGRRSIYLEVRRNFLTPLLLAFDYPLPTATAGRRMVSTVPAQALALMNNEFVARQAQMWSERMESSHTGPRARLDAMFVRIFARAPEPAERDRVQTFLSAEGSWSDLAHVLFNAKEFLFLK
ncbi:MAG: PSD1 and planctomycete cytochrome C domain-containing protein [Bryobacteraceae bacterium]